MKKPLILLFLVFSIYISSAFAQADSIKVYVLDALQLMKNRSVNKDQVDWEKVYATALADATNAKTIRATYPIIRNAMAQLKDAHSKFFPPEMVKAYLLGYRATGQKFPVIDTAFLANRYAYISLPSIASYNFNDWNEYVNTFYLKVAKLQQRKPKGWIIDLRDNEGGMFYPMYAAISPFLDHTRVIGMKDRAGKVLYFGYKNGKLYENNKVMHHFSINKLRLKALKEPISILINKGTASSGEFAAIAFAGQQNVSFIGENTAGLTSGNQEHKLADGAFIALTEGNTIDRLQNEYSEIGKGLIPKFKIEAKESTKNNDLYIKKALEVLGKK